MVATLVDVSDTIQAHYSNCTDEKMKEELAMEYHTTRRSFDEGAFCRPGDLEEWKATVRGGLVFGLAAVQKLWFDEAFLWDHLEIPSMFTEALPYHSTVKNKGERFEIYMQAFRVIDKENFLEQANLLYLAMPNKSEAGWDTVAAIFAAFLEGGSSYYVGRSIKGGFWRYWGTKKAAVEKEGASGYAKQTKYYRDVVCVTTQPLRRGSSSLQLAASPYGTRAAPYVNDRGVVS
jgi:hypothetical protein